jgi:aminopeptidase N
MKQPLIKFLPICLLVALACKTSRTTTIPSGNSSVSDSESTVPAQVSPYRATYEQYWDLVHTQLDLRPRWSTRTMDGVATILLHPHWYATDSLVLNARGMDIKKVKWELKEMQEDSAAFTYDGKILTVHFPEQAERNDTLLVAITYTAQPEKLPEGGSEAIQGDKGLYFINADGKNPDKPTQLWTQGETESNCVWFPTIESPAQKMTQDIFLTVDPDYTTLSNGLLVESKANPDGSRTDHWKQKLPATPYLTMIAVGHFSITKDRWRDKEVSYYVDPEYGKFARTIFGETPTMIEFFSQQLGVPYPWEKFSQVVVHDYVSGAMENTTAVVHGTNMQQDPREMLDGDYSDYIAHELFHHWFGDLVTCESWSNLTLNEGFADYSEYLWREHRYGKESADCEFKKSMSAYIGYSKEVDAPLIRYTYLDREDMYDAISYNKGGCVLHMLRAEVGDEAFFAALKDYLTVNAYGSAEIHDLRKSFEKITGRDLNWFFHQWFMQGGHPVLDINYVWNDSLHTQTVIIQQLQDLNKNPLYELPLKVDIYTAEGVEHKSVVCRNQEDRFEFESKSKPLLVNVDAAKSLLCSKKDHHSSNEWCYQYTHAPLYADRHEALSAITKNYTYGTPEAAIVNEALNDGSPRLRQMAVDNIAVWAKKDSVNTMSILNGMVKSDSSSDVRMAALKALKKHYGYVAISDAVHAAVNDSSYEVAGAAFEIIAANDTLAALKISGKLEQDSGGAVLTALASFYSSRTDTSLYSFYDRAIRLTKSWNRSSVIKSFGLYLKQQRGDLLHRGISRLTLCAETATGRFARSGSIAALRSLKNNLEENGKTIASTGTEEDAAQLDSELDRIQEVLDKFDNASKGLRDDE